MTRDLELESAHRRIGSAALTLREMNIMREPAAARSVLSNVIKTLQHALDDIDRHFGPTPKKQIRGRVRGR